MLLLRILMWCVFTYMCMLDFDKQATICITTETRYRVRNQGKGMIDQMADLLRLELVYPWAFKFKFLFSENFIHEYCIYTISTKHSSLQFFPSSPTSCQIHDLFFNYCYCTQRDRQTADRQAHVCKETETPTESIQCCLNVIY